MSREYIITMTAENRVGILAAVTNAMAELGAELREASQTVVCGFFTMIFAAEFPEDREQQVILDHLRGVCGPFDIEVSMAPAIVTEASDSARTVKRLRLCGKDVPGILRRIGVKMSMDQIDIIGMHAWRVGSDRFELVMKLAIPDGYPLEELPEDLRNLEPEWQLEVELDDYQPASAFTNET